MISPTDISNKIQAEHTNPTINDNVPVRDDIKLGVLRDSDTQSHILRNDVRADNAISTQRRPINIRNKSKIV